MSTRRDVVRPRVEWLSDVVYRYNLDKPLHRFGICLVVQLKLWARKEISSP